MEALSLTPSVISTILVHTKINLNEDVGTWPPSKEGGGAVNVGYEPSGPHRVLAARPGTEAHGLVDGG
eukprot:15476897-Alexandrium_andersonii.AAC.1